VVDTGGLEPDTREGIFSVMAQQVALALDEADAILFVVDGRQGLTHHDRAIAERLRATGRPIWLIVNKAEGMNRSAVTAEFHELGLGDPLAISAAHGEGVSDLIDIVLEPYPAETAEDAAAAERHPRIAVVGRPNVGKSTLVNRVLGEERVIAFDKPGTTRDAIEIEFERDGRPYSLIDTAGLRKRGRVEEAVEKFSVVKTLQAIADANVVILVLDARQDIAEQDAHIAGFVLDAGRALVIAVNKWTAGGGGARPCAAGRGPRARLPRFCPGALHLGAVRDRPRGADGLGGRRLRRRHGEALHAAAHRALIAATRGSRRRAPDAAAQAAIRPPGRYESPAGDHPRQLARSRPGQLPALLERFFRDVFKLQGTPLRIELRSSSRNPYARKR